MGTERITFSTRRFLVGKAGPFPRLVFREEVMLALDQFSHLHSQGEHGGFLIGRKQKLKTAEEYEIMVERFVPIPQRNDVSRLVIHQDHYRTVELALKQGEEILGWSHTHPGFGVFLSDFDKQQHQRFFPESWQIAYVMDTHAQERAAYHLVQGQWKRLGGYYVLRDMAENEMGITAEGRPSPWLRIAIALLALFLLVGGVTIGFPIIRDMYFGSEPVAQLVSEAESVVSVNSEQPVKETETQASDPAPNVPAVEPGSVTIAPPSTVPRYMDYVVERGDTLWTIAKKLWGDPSLFNIIVEENGLTNPSLLRTGMTLRVPVDPRQK